MARKLAVLEMYFCFCEISIIIFFVKSRRICAASETRRPTAVLANLSKPGAVTVCPRAVLEPRLASLGGEQRLTVSLQTRVEGCVI